MKTFSVNKNSWHYKLNVRMSKTNERLNQDNNAEKFVQSKDNLCSYWRMTLWSMFKITVAYSFVAVVIFGLLGLIFMYLKSLILNTAYTVAATAMTLGAFSIIVGIVALAIWLDKRKAAKLNKILYEGETETSLTKAQYSSWKHGVCVPVEFKE